MSESEQPKFDRSLLTAYVDGELSPEKQNEVEKAIKDDSTLNQELTEIRQIQSLVRGAFDGIENIEVGPAVQSRIAATKDVELPASNSNRFVNRKLLAAIAACLAVLIGLPAIFSRSAFLGTKLSETSGSETTDSSAALQEDSAAENTADRKVAQPSPPTTADKKSKTSIAKGDTSPLKTPKIAVPNYSPSVTELPRRVRERSGIPDSSSAMGMAAADFQTDVPEPSRLAEPLKFYNITIGSDSNLKIERSQTVKLEQTQIRGARPLRMTKARLISAMTMAGISTTEIERFAVPSRLRFEIAPEVVAALLPHVIRYSSPVEHRPPRLLGPVHFSPKKWAEISIKIE